ncbi:portal protein, partial [Herbiconiux daphne]
RDKAARNYQYYHGELPVFGDDCVLPITDRTCKTFTNGALKDLVEVFLSNDHEPIQFVPESAGDDNVLAMAATKLVRQAYNDNDGDLLIASVLKESLINGVAFVKRHYTTQRETITTQAKGLKDEAEAQGYILAWREGGLKIDDADIELTENEDGTFDLVCTYEGEFEGVKIYHAPLEEILFDQKASSINGALNGCTYFCHRVRKTKAKSE